MAAQDDPNDHESLAKHLYAIMSDDGLRASLSEIRSNTHVNSPGKPRARRTLEVYKAVHARSGQPLLRR